MQHKTMHRNKSPTAKSTPARYNQIYGAADHRKHPPLHSSLPFCPFCDPCAVVASPAQIVPATPSGAAIARGGSSANKTIHRRDAASHAPTTVAADHRKAAGQGVVCETRLMGQDPLAEITGLRPRLPQVSRHFFVITCLRLASANSAGRPSPASEASGESNSPASKSIRLEFANNAVPIYHHAAITVPRRFCPDAYTCHSDLDCPARGLSPGCW